MKMHARQSSVIFIVFGLCILIGIILFIGLHASSSFFITRMPFDFQITRTKDTPRETPTTPPLDIADNSSSTQSALHVSAFSVFLPFTITIADGWSAQKKHSQKSVNISITDGEYSLEISRQASTTFTCLFHDESTTTSSIMLHDPVELVGISGMYLRALLLESVDYSKQRFIICEKQSGVYITPTKFGAISYITPLKPSPQQLLIMDIMIASIQ